MSKKVGPGCVTVGLYVFGGLILLSIIIGVLNPGSGDMTFEQRDSIRLAQQAQKDSIEAAFYEGYEKRVSEATKGLKKKVDDFSETTFFYGGSIPYVNVNRLYVYMGYQEGKLPSLRMKIQYASDDWLFIRSYSIKADGQTFDYRPFKIKRDNDDGKIWEWCDETVRDEERALLDAIVKAGKATIRYRGDDYHKDRNLTANEVASIKMVLEAYDKIQDSK